LENKKKLIYVLHGISVGGVEVALISAIPALYQRYDLKVVVLGKINQKLLNNLSEEEKRVFQQFDYPIYLYPFILRKIVSHILEFQPEIMICSLWRASLVGVVVKLLMKKIRFFSFNHSTRFPHLLSAFFTWLAAKCADTVLTDGIATKIFVQSRLNPHVAIRVVSFLTAPTPSIIYKDIPDDGCIYFMFLGRINKVKNLPLAIRVIKFLTEKGIRAKLDIFGPNDGDITDYKSLIDSLKLKDIINFKGEVDPIQRTSLFKHYHFYIQLSSFEGMAMSVAESMQHGLVCIVSPVGEIVHYAKDMESAIFIDIFNTENWELDLNKILRAIEDRSLYNELSKACHQNFMQKQAYPYDLINALESS
jgi:glycosyltransferase involved in cell wall biosynthesis